MAGQQSQPVAVDEASIDASPQPASTTEASSSQSVSPAKNRFSLNMLRLPFSPPRKPATAAGVTAKRSADSTPDLDATLDSAPACDPVTESALVDPSPKDRSVKQYLAPPPNEARPIRSALAPAAEASSRRASRTTSPHRVSFSPSTEDMAEAREQAQSFAVLDDGTSAKSHGKSHNKSKTKTNLPKWRGLKSRSSSDLPSSTRRQSVESVRSDSSVGTSSSAERFESNAALPGAAAAKRRLFRWDRKGIHHASTSEKSKAAKVKVTKHQAVAARHAKTLEQVINAGMGLHPIPPRLSSSADIAATDSEQQGKGGGRKKKAPRAKPVPVVGRSQLKGLKSALLDVDSANNIIKELRAMPVPLDKLRSGLGQIVPDATIGTAGDHGQERILTVDVPDTMLEGNVTKDDSEIRKRPGATMDALDATTTVRPPIERKAKSAAEEALRKITLRAETSTSPQKAVVTARTSSLPPTADDPLASPASTAPPTSPSPPTKPTATQSGARPLKMVCLDCGEAEAHQRHAQQLEAAAVVTGAPSTEEKNGAFNVTTIATGAAAALAGVGGLLAARSAPDAESKMEAPSARPPMIKSLSVANLPTLRDGPRLMGSTPLQLILDPVGTVAQNSGAFDVLADVSGAAIRATQDMDSIHPPLDRMAIFVHWWGFEITLPKASMAYLGTAHSVSGAFLSFLQTMALGGGVPELLPFIKYISTFMEVEYKAIQAQDQGHGVCIAGTWFMPMALVPRPWDYPLDGPQPEKPGTGAPASQATYPSTLGQDTAPVMMPMPGVGTEASVPAKKHAFKRKSSADTFSEAAVAQVVMPQRNFNPTQLAAIQAARAEKMPQDLSANMNGAAALPGAQVEAALASVQEVPEIGSLRIKA
ncbi:hypothetical protein EX895_004083 [Sporisorium graminicola]|uniref:Uncharacterized protein n=1 Tax=Sporisorium graminicola TaxID=280036 RepID=A0A4U7KTI3_9BASI|nr:hypothetical protein EX895_004083 [Sporisorium graminicola]TKY87406.1 hypothetical protein EX895_004083 [Sporisorium graminicola]